MFEVNKHTTIQIGVGVQGDGCIQGVCKCSVSTVGVQQREPSVLHQIVDAVSSEEGANLSPSFLVSIP